MVTSNMQNKFGKDTWKVIDVKCEKSQYICHF